MKTFFVGLKDKLITIKETANGYQFNESLHETNPTRLAFDPSNKQRIYCATNGDGLWRSEDGGEHWSNIGVPSVASDLPKNRGISSSKMSAVAVHPTKKVNGHSVVYAGTEPSMLFYSEDHGESWHEFEGMQKMPSQKDWAFPPRPWTHYVRWITPSYSNKDHLAVSIEAGAVLNSYDHGKTWKDRTEDSPIDVHTLLAHPKAPKRLYAANGDGKGRSYAESYDEGLTWIYMTEGLEQHPYGYHLVLHPENPTDRLISASKSASSAHGSNRYSTIYRKVDTAPWIELADGLPREDAFTHHLANDPDNVGAFYALNNFGLFYLKPGGNQWERLDIPWEEYENKRPYSFAVEVLD